MKKFLVIVLLAMFASKMGYGQTLVSSQVFNNTGESSHLTFTDDFTNNYLYTGYDGTSTYTPVWVYVDVECYYYGSPNPDFEDENYTYPTGNYSCYIDASYPSIDFSMYYEIRVQHTILYDTPLGYLSDQYIEIYRN